MILIQPFRYCLILIFLLISIIARSDSSSSDNQKIFDRNSYQELIEGLDYSEESPEPKRAGKKFGWEGAGPSAAIAIKFIGFAILGALLIFLIYQIATNWIIRSNKKIHDQLPSEYELQPDQHIDDVNLKKMLETALQKEEYREAVRLYFLIVLKELNRFDLIHWRREKTNRDYFNEIKINSLKKDFSKVARIFKKAWYGEAVVNNHSYSQYAMTSDELIKEIEEGRI
mgnify:CR=1 FL=1